MKSQIVAEKVELVKQVRLTSKQRLTLVEMQNNGGRCNRGHIDYSVRGDLQMLGLIEERDQLTAAEKKSLDAAISVTWKSIPAMVKARNAEGLNRAVESIRARTHEIGRKTWWITAAANEYLTVGRVTITR